MPKYNCKENQTGYEIMYDIDGQSIQLFACYEGDFLKTFTHGMGGWDGGQKTKNVPVTLEKMRMVEKSIEAHCNANGLSAKMHNNCINIECND